ncbi:MAG: sulfatase-like hydrolase/transferase [Gammaproteobacteria bacterium]|nr:sulfatase-like hydrolase/transferase [Gammaproteobacteria bacterium]MDH3414850.1 sulfatase-like hydrolase/transferase [Gammaproteobacteria bacterium]
MKFIPLWFLLFSSLATHAADRPNILLIYVDDLGYGDLGSYGHPVLRTPNIDSLATDGLRLTNYYAPSALCSPSRAGLLTGRHPYRTGIKSWIPEDSGVYLRDAEITLAEVLKEAGYATAHIGKWHLNSDLSNRTEPQPTDQGFDYFYGHNAFQIPHNFNPTNIYRNKKALPMQEGYTADLYAGEAIRWLEKRDQDEPFFLYLSMAEPHTSIANPPEYNAMYAQYSRGKIEPIVNGLKDPPKESLVPRGPGEYYANITYMDAQLGRVLGWLRDHKLEQNTVVVFSSDNGAVTSQWINWWEVNAYGSTGGYRGRKHYLYEGGLKVPTIVRFPGVVKSGSVSDATVIGMDLFVTLANIGGGKVPDDRAIDGIDIQPIFRGDDLPQRGLFWALDSVSDLEFAIQKESWKLLLDRDQEPRELYNLADDPLEFFNLISKEPAKTRELTDEAAKHLAAIANDPLRPN